MSQMFGPALDAELAYRRERAARAYAAPSLWQRWRRRRHRAAAAAARARSAPADHRLTA